MKIIPSPESVKMKSLSKISFGLTQILFLPLVADAELLYSCQKLEFYLKFVLYQIVKWWIIEHLQFGLTAAS